MMSACGSGDFMLNVRALLTVILVFWPSMAVAQAAGVAERLAGEIRTALPGATVTIPDPNGLDITYGGQTRPLGIGSVNQSCALGATMCDEAIHSYARKAVDYMLEAIPPSPSQLRAFVRGKPDQTASGIQHDPLADFIVEPLAGDLLSVCYRDLAKGRRPILTADLKAMRLDRQAALAACNSNAVTELPPLASQWHSLPKKGIGVIENGDDVTGYLLRPSDWRPLADQLGGLIVACPSSDAVLYSRGSNAIDAEVLSLLAAQMFKKSANPVSTQVFRWTDAGWVPVTR